MPGKIATSSDRLGVSLFANGVLFGLQPDAIFAIVPALTLPTRLAAAAYIGMFVFGTVAAMGSYTAVIGEHAPSILCMAAYIASYRRQQGCCLPSCNADIGTLMKPTCECRYAEVHL